MQTKPHIKRAWPRLLTHRFEVTQIRIRQRQVIAIELKKGSSWKIVHRWSREPTMTREEMPWQWTMFYAGEYEGEGALRVQMCSCLKEARRTARRLQARFRASAPDRSER